MSAKVILTGLFLSTALFSCHGETTLKGTFDMGGVKGTVVFSQSGVGQATSVNFKDLTGIQSTMSWEIHSFWVDLTTPVKDKCSDEQIGVRMYNNVGGSVNSGSSSVSIAATNLSDLRDLMGRSILLHTGQIKSCATLHFMTSPSTVSADYTYAQVSLRGSVTGKVIFRQAVNSDRTEILTDFYKGEPTASSTYMWKIYGDKAADCKSLKNIFDPAAKSSAGCTPSSPLDCPVGDLTGKLADAKVGSSIGKMKQFYQDKNLPLMNETTKVLGKFLVLLKPDKTILSCAEIMTLPEKTAKAVFSREKIFGIFLFKQRSPIDPTKLQVTLYGLRNMAGGYHIHDYPVLYHVSENQKLCSNDAVSGHFNPFNIQKPWPAAAVGTTDQYEIGDLSNKFGLLTGKTELAMSDEDYNLPMFGVNSIVGRSLVIHKNAQGAPRWVCSNIEEIKNMVIAMATFKYPVIGHVMLKQHRDDPTADTTVFIEMNYGDGTTAPTSSHMLMVHENKVGDSFLAAGPARCGSVGPVYNPFSVPSTYKSMCKPENQLQCKLGDLSGAGGRLSIRLASGVASKAFFTHTNLPLSGPNLVIGRSVVIRESNGGMGKLACADIIEVPTRFAKVNSWHGDVTGTVGFSQLSGLLFQSTFLSVNLSNLNNIAGPYGIHSYPISSDSKTPCSTESAGMRYNPFHINGSASPPDTHDLHEVGDLSGKFGLLTNKTHYDWSGIDNNLNLFGTHSIVGRSVVVQKTNNPTSSSCGTIMDVTGGRLYKARATFMKDTGLIGSILMSQNVFSDGSMSDTSIMVDLKYGQSDKVTFSHNWHVHEKPVWGDDVGSNSDPCKSCGPHYNPYMVNVKTGYEECGPVNPLRCELGDQASKLGTYSIGGKKMFVTDIDLPLVGPRSVIGRSIVIHVENKGSARLACADILPVDAPTVQLFIAKLEQSKVDKTDIVKTYAKALNTGTWNLAVVVGYKDDKTNVIVHFAGQEAQTLKRAFEKILMSKDNNILGKYAPLTSGAGQANLSATVLSLLLFSLWCFE